MSPSAEFVFSIAVGVVLVDADGSVDKITFQLTQDGRLIVAQALAVSEGMDVLCGDIGPMRAAYPVRDVAFLRPGPHRTNRQHHRSLQRKDVA